ncbi:MAG: peptidylprolyl isomerase [Bacteroidales bacterium]|nr:peptidylprolyl isomerase [Bacteroidales bacterium]
MKRLIVAISLIVTFFTLDAQNDTLMTIAGQAVTSGEFLRIYNKNNSVETISDKKSVEDYLDLFINFKLKVVEAEALGMDTIDKFQRELGGYRNQLEKPYFIDLSIQDKLVKEAYDRSQYDVRASHILIMVGKDANPADTLMAYKKIEKIRNDIVSGKTTFEEAARTKSEDPSVKMNLGDLGYFTVFQMVYPFENAAFNTPVGEVSDIVRTRYGYHILKVNDKRKAKGEVLVAHIMVALAKDADTITAKAAEKKIGMIYDKLQKGEKFEELAQLYSDDKASAKKGGELQWFGTSHMVPVFEEASFSLENKGDYSKPVKTDFGWHIIKLLDRRAPQTFEESEKKIKDRVAADMRSRLSKDAVLNKLKAEYGYKLNPKSMDEMYANINAGIFSGEWKLESINKLKKTLFSLNDSAYSQQAFGIFLEKNTRTKRKEEEVKVFINRMFDLYVENELKAVERENLPNKYDEYRYLLQEYHDGILLFDLTEKMVWSKAIEDSVGLAEFYARNKEKYMWGQRAEAEIFQAKDAKTLSKLKKLLAKKDAKGYSAEDILKMLNKKDSAAVELIAEKVYSKGDYALLDEANETLKFFENPDAKAPIYFEKATKLVFIDKIIPTSYKLLGEAKGQITADYQDELEKQWIKTLREKYPIVINEKVWEVIKANN